MRTRTRTVGLVVVALLVVLAGCSAGMQGDSGAAEPSDGQSFDTSANTEAASSGDSNYFQGEELGSTSIQIDRARIMTGNVHLEVEEFDDARTGIVTATQERGGFVSGSDTNLHRKGNQTWRTGEVVLRVPRENFTSLMNAIESEGTVVSTGSDSKDVTDQLVDIEARLSNLQSQRETLRELYDDANETEDVLEVQERLSEVQTEIEQLEAQQQSLENRVAYSTITVRLGEPEPGQPTVTQRVNWYEKGFIAALLSSIDGVVIVVRAMVIGLAYALPYLAVFGIPIGGVALVVIRRRGLP